MTIKTFRYTIIILLGVILQGCSDDSSLPKTSTDRIELGKYINLEGYKPLQVKWSYKKLGNQSDSRVPGSNDYRLEALLQFEKETIGRLKKNYNLLSVSFRELRKEQFRFKWLDKNNLNKLNNNSLIYYHPNFFKKGSLIHGGYIIINENTILLSLQTM